MYCEKERERGRELETQRDRIRPGAEETGEGKREEREEEREGSDKRGETIPNGLCLTVKVFSFLFQLVAAVATTATAVVVISGICVRFVV